MLIAFYVLLGVLLLMAFFFALVHPLLCIVDCALSKEHSLGSKITWILAAVTMGFVAAFTYTLMGTNSKWLRKSTRYAFTLSAVCVLMVIGIFYTSPEVKALVNEANSKATTAARLAESGEPADLSTSGNENSVDENTVAFDTQLENFQKQVQQLRARKLGPNTLVVEAGQEEDPIPAGQPISTASPFQSDDSEPTHDEGSDDSADSAMAELDDDSLELEVQVPAAVDASEFTEAWGDVASILDEPIAEPQSAPASDLPAEASTTAELNADSMSDEETKQDVAADAPPSPTATELEEPADSPAETTLRMPAPTSTAAQTIDNSTFSSSATKQKAGSEPARSIPTSGVRTSGNRTQSEPSKPAEPDSRPFNRYRGTSEPLNLDFPTPPIRNRYINP